MHRIVWTAGGDRTACFAEDGLFDLPPRVGAALGASGMALVGRHAVLLTAAGPRALSPGVAVGDGATSLAWEPPSRRSRLERAGTRGDERHPGRPPCELTTWTGIAREVGGTPLVVGRHPGCDVALTDSHVSQFHCALVRQEGAVIVADLHSRNGTFVDGVRVPRAVLTRRVALRLGHSRIVLAPADVAGELTGLPSPPMRALADRARRIAPTRAPVLIQGESGTGKDVLAQHIHRESGRAGPLVALNAATVAPALAASELFGHVRGAFTGAERDHAGVFLRAHEGTLFLDEVAELPPGVQAELLRAVELGRVRRLGESHEVPVDVRIIAATHRDLAARVRAGLFREDLYHRLCVVPLVVPPLRERLQDLDVIADRFLASQEEPWSLSPAARAKLRHHPWRGNVRELLNTLRRACAFGEGGVVEAKDIVFVPDLSPTPNEIESVLQARVAETYAQTHDVAETARRLGVRRSLVHRVLRAERGSRARLVGGRSRG